MNIPDFTTSQLENNRISFVEAKAGDFSQIIEIDQELFPKQRLGRSDFINVSSDSKQYGKLKVIVLDKKEIIGFTIFGVFEDDNNEKRGYITRIGITEKFQRKGIGGFIINQILSEFKEQEAKQAVLDVRESNIEAQKFYEAKGFVRYDIRENAYWNNENSYVYVKNIMPYNKNRVKIDTKTLQDLFKWVT